MATNQRKILMCSKQVQVALLRRVALYWLLCLWCMYCVFAGFPMVASWLFGMQEGLPAAKMATRMLLNLWPPLVATGLVLPFVIWDVLRFSNRFSGPAYRLTVSLRDLADGKPVRPVKFRDGDHWMELADEFNRVLERFDVPSETVGLPSTTESADEGETVAV